MLFITVSTMLFTRYITLNCICAVSLTASRQPTQVSVVVLQLFWLNKKKDLGENLKHKPQWSYRCVIELTKYANIMIEWRLYDKWDVLTIELHGLRWQSEGNDKWDVLTIELHGLRWQSESYDKWDVLIIELHGLRWQSEDYDKWDVLTIELHGLRWQSEGNDKWDVLTIELHGLRWQSECYDKWDVLTIELHTVDSDSIPKVIR